MKSAALLLFTCAIACSGGMRRGGPGTDPPATGLAAGIRITEIAFYQTLKAQLMKDSVAATPAVPLVQGRAGLLRVFVEPAAEWQPRELIARVDFEPGGAIEQRFTPSGASTDGTLGSTANIDVPGDKVVGGLTFQVSLREVDASVKAPGATDGAAWPAEAKNPFETGDTGEALHVVVVPVQYNADGSGRLPDTSQPQLDAMKAEMWNLYPARTVDLTVEAPMGWSSACSPQGQGWSQLLQAIANKRRSDGVPKNVYYYGLFAPAASLASFCGGGCVAGLSLQAMSVQDDYARASIGLGFGGNQGRMQTVDTFVHEVGHAHGRAHSPCMLLGQPADPQYPYAGAKIGHWGWNPTTKALVDPEGMSRDLMGYCQPIWISDYTYKALYTRVQALNAMARIIPGPESKVEFKSEIVDADPQTPGTRYYPFDHLPGGILVTD
jgi:hypothetical protein